MLMFICLLWLLITCLLLAFIRGASIANEDYDRSMIRNLRVVLGKPFAHLDELDKAA